MSEPHSSAAVEKQKIFFPNLDGLRFFSFLVVFFSHIFETKHAAIKSTLWYRIFKVRIFSDGDLGVSFFFVLSGFLITYLLLKEKEFTKKIDVRSFYVRRALRIWPLYYFSVFFGFVIFPFLKSYLGQVPDEPANPVMCSLFLNNFDRIINGPPDSSILSVLWSVAIEEQFYLVWPIFFFLIPPRYYHYIFIFVITISLGYRIMNVNDPHIEIHSLGVISDMAIGGLGAYLSINNKKFLKHIENTPPLLSLLPYIAAIVFLVFKYELFYVGPIFAVKRLIVAFFFIWIILDQNFCKKSYFKVSRLKVISKLGKYTYGLYCLHCIAILITIVLLDKLGLRENSWELLLIELPLAMTLSIILSYLSYTLFESKFLKLKDRFAYIVKS